ncbi:cytochrome P460 family protein [Sphingobacterium sp.]|uniref:cytochrome P460 family protein n=1 Tax=Sphingobacterium sp. TaxID=341027 RepID=UPI0028AD9D0E|nr:cytochrome P460 family protein [Sphingobacterium sp.]
MKKIRLVVLSIAVIIALMQLIRPEQPSNIPSSDLPGIPQEVNAILRSSCFDCHSSQTNLRWYDQLTPANYLVNDHIIKGRKALDFSNWSQLTPAVQNTKLYYSLNKILWGQMPLPSYLLAHPQAALSEKDIHTLKDFVRSRKVPIGIDTIKTDKIKQQFTDFVRGKMGQSKQTVQPTPNGISYISDYRNWNIISITDRFDNGTLRMIYGNDIAVRAIQEGRTNPWPDGAVLAKAAWKQVANADGSLSTGDFVQVEFMIKDAKQYAATAGWGWARWRGKDLKPYGGTALFTAECIACHQPVKANDFVFTRPLDLKKLTAKNH